MLYNAIQVILAGQLNGRNHCDALPSAGFVKDTANASAAAKLRGGSITYIARAYAIGRQNSAADCVLRSRIPLPAGSAKTLSKPIIMIYFRRLERASGV